MKRVFRKLACAAMAATMMFTSVPVADFGYLAPLTVQAASQVGITESSGWLESAWVEWNPSSTSGVSYYKVSYSGTASGTIDNELIRQYKDGHWRADIVGIAAGNYTITVSAYSSSGSVVASETASVTVKAHDRAGYTFHPSSTTYDSSDPLQCGGYKGDGTPKDGAEILYITSASDIDSITDSTGTTGLSTILEGRNKRTSTPLIVRIVGKIDYSGSQLNSSGYIQIKPSSAYTNSQITIEGIGPDATTNFGFLVRNAGNVEIRNLAIHDFADDGISLDTDNCNIWLHNCEFFYGVQGSGDKAKGDGSSDLKGDSQYITFSYNHYWDSGKCSLCGMKSETGDNYITYHHNWFDHSDSRHPRIRTMFVHIYNNYYDGNAKYGVGAAMDSSAFVEGNYFRNCKHPMLSSLQGSDIMENEKTGVADFSGDGTFSGENGGIIKAYNNYIEGADSNELTGGTEPVYYNASDTSSNGAATQFDAYLASSRSEQVPSSVKALVGSKTFDNSNVDSYILNSITPEEPAAAKSTVETYAGRTGGGDFAAASGFAFSDATDDTDYAINTTLRTALTNYCNDSVSSNFAISSIGGSVDGSFVPVETTTSSGEESTEATTEGTDESTTKNTEQSTEATTEEDTETTTVDPSGAASMGIYKFGKSASSGDFNVTENGATYGNIVFNFRSVETSNAKLRSDNATTIKLAGETKVDIEYVSGPGVVMTNGSETYTFDDATTYNVLPAGTYTLKGVSDSNSTISGMTLIATGTVETSTEATTQSTTEATTQTTTVSTTESTTRESSTETTTQAPSGDISALTAGTYTAATIATDTSKFTVTGNSVTDGTAVKINESGSVVFKVSDNANVTITYKCGSSDPAKSASISCAGQTGTTLAGGATATTADLALTNLSAGEYTITATQTGGTTAQIISITVSYGGGSQEEIKGDADGSGSVNASDVTYILAYSAGKNTTVDLSADVTGDGKVTVADAYVISRYVLGITSSL